MSKKKNIKGKNKSMKQHSFNSMNSKTGYLDTGNDAQVHAKARAMRNNDNESY
ncbi:hypothetical protein CLOACE_05840 [Clostridium acetireducens DSM 10703]|jgi:hypothetical protein|uniref:Uncharacterized protein n=1 Tax=Clostridium acetireducens DSM 10703 TaxID=1121290 RepID=A0A1E8F0Q3_9CLOT|nr:hypothetical protein [Clostridium acetireducens]OFI06998.1 hypothetical protein CLOACE_05840 [Clostridium acetireducens DSM 10703]